MFALFEREFPPILRDFAQQSIFSIFFHAQSELKKIEVDPKTPHFSANSILSHQKHWPKR